jgi:hypothetical protein
MQSPDNRLTGVHGSFPWCETFHIQVQFFCFFILSIVFLGRRFGNWILSPNCVRFVRRRKHNPVSETMYCFKYRTKVMSRNAAIGLVCHHV